MTRASVGGTESPETTGRLFTAAISHEIRTPLNGILGMASLLGETELAPSQRQYVEAIQRSGETLLGLLNNILDYSRLEGGGIPLDEVRFDPGEIIQDVVELIAPRAHERGLDIAASALGPHVEVIGDAGRIRQILFNLAGNAVKFTASGAILIAVGPGPGGMVRLSVADTGEGIPSDRRDGLFDAFSQVRASDAARESGVGLGLAISARLASAMNGRIGLLSRVGEGSVFYIDLPLRPYPNTADPPVMTMTEKVWLDLPPASAWAVMTAIGAAGGSVCACAQDADLAIIDAALPPARIAQIAASIPSLIVLRPEDRAHLPRFRELGACGYLIRPLRRASILERMAVALREGGSSGTPGEPFPKSRSLQGVRILIADDNPVNALLARRTLEAEGCIVDPVSTGAEALEAASDTVYDLIVMDIRMPVMNGYEATQRIRALDGLAARVPIIAVTADIDPDLQSKAQAAGVSIVASKPMDPGRLRSLVREWASLEAP